MARRSARRARDNRYRGLAQSWRDFAASARSLADNSVEFHEKYANKWVALYKGKVEVVGDSFDEIMSELRVRKIPSNKALVRFVGEKEMTLIL